MERYSHPAAAMAADPDVAYRVELDHVDAAGFERAREYVAAHDGAVAVAVRHDERLLFVDNAAYDGWVLPGGRVENGEAFRAAAAREVREETGVEARVGDPLLVQNTVARHDGDTVGGYVVCFEAVATEPTPADDPGEPDEDIRAVRWTDAVPAGTSDLPAAERVLSVVAERYDWLADGR